MVVHEATARRGSAEAVLDTAVSVLVADPAASLTQVAEAAGIGRTTLHKHFATRDDLLRAVGFRAIELWERATDAIAESTDADGGLAALTEAMVPIGPYLAFLWRTPRFDHDCEIGERWQAVEHRAYAVLDHAREQGVLRAGVPDQWLLQTFYSLVYVAAESVRTGHLAPRDAAGRVVDTFLHGVGTPRKGDRP
jgi:AcrR family transcriptional regulator